MDNLEQILLDRTCKYGAFEDNAKRASRIYHHMVSNAPQLLTQKDLSIYYEALHMIAVKISRLVNGGIDDADGWFDIAGYAVLIHNYLAKEHGEKNSDGKSVSDESLLKNLERKIEAEINEHEVSV